MPGWQWPFTSQHPVAQLLALQPCVWQVRLALQVSLELQPTQCNPLAPQAVLEVPAWHLPVASQQPLQVEDEQRVFTQVLLPPPPPQV